MTEQPRIVSIDLTHLVRAALAAEAASGRDADGRMPRAEQVTDPAGERGADPPQP